MPQASPMEARVVATRGRSRLTKIVLGVVVAAALGCGAVSTGLVHVPGLNSDATAPQNAAVTTDNPQQTDDGDHTIAGRLAVLTPDVIKSRHLNTGRSAGMVLIEVFSNGPS